MMFFNQETMEAAQRIKFVLYQQVSGNVDAASMDLLGIFKFILHIFSEIIFGLLWHSVGSKECLRRISEKYKLRGSIFKFESHFGNLGSFHILQLYI